MHQVRCIQGGITSSDIATKALEARSAMVIGQALAGVPLWQLGPESRLPGVPYIVFPGDLITIILLFFYVDNYVFAKSHLTFYCPVGNVGDNGALAEVVKNWACPLRSSTKDLLLVSSTKDFPVRFFYFLFEMQILMGFLNIKNAEKGGYAVGAFNVYNLEGVEAVVAAAEAEKSPAILQVISSLVVIILPNYNEFLVRKL